MLQEVCSLATLSRCARHLLYSLAVSGVVCGSKLRPCHTCCASSASFTSFVLQVILKACPEFQLYLIHDAYGCHMGAFMSRRPQPILRILGGVPLAIPYICSCLVPRHTMYVGVQGACWIMML